MSIRFTIFLYLLIAGCSSKVRTPLTKLPENKIRSTHYGLPGNLIQGFIPDPNGRKFLIDPVEDTVTYKHVIDNIYQDDSGNIYILTQGGEDMRHDSIMLYEFFKDYSDFFDLRTYHKIGKGFFANKGQVYFWWLNDCWDYPVEVSDADPATFIPFNEILGGKDAYHVYYGGPLDFAAIEGADPKTFIILPLVKGNYNQYFKDINHVFFESEIIPGADPATFHIIDKDSVDAADKQMQYLDGKPVHLRE